MRGRGSEMEGREGGGMERERKKRMGQDILGKGT